MNGLWVILPDGESFVVQEGPFVAFLDVSMTAEADPQVGETHLDAVEQCSAAAREFACQTDFWRPCVQDYVLLATRGPELAHSASQVRRL